MTEISIVLCSYNGANYIREQLESIFRQSVLPDELIVCDDNSSDSTLSVVATCAAVSPFPIRIIRNSATLGYQRNFMKGAAAATGRIVFFCDQDDIWLPNKIESVRRILESNDVNAVSHDFSLTDSGGNIIHQSYYRYLVNAGHAVEVSIQGCALAYRREIIDKYGWPRSIMGHDLWICLLSSMEKTRRIHPRALILHRIHNNNVKGLWKKDSLALRYLRRLWNWISLPKSEFERLIARFGDENVVTTLASVVEDHKRELPSQTVKSIVTTLQSRRNVLKFRSDPRYGSIVFRLFRGSALLIGNHYQVAGGFLGYVKDLVGRSL